jgi:hypothetical protein
VKTYAIPISTIPPINFPSIASTDISFLSYLWERVGHTAGSAIGGQNGDSRTGSHLEGLMTLSLVSSVGIVVRESSS